MKLLRILLILTVVGFRVGEWLFDADNFDEHFASHLSTIQPAFWLWSFDVLSELCVKLSICGKEAETVVFVSMQRTKYSSNLFVIMR